jgi:hypothetical protein
MKGTMTCPWPDAARLRRLARRALVGSLFAVGVVVAFRGINARASDAGAGAASARAQTTAESATPSSARDIYCFGHGQGHEETTFRRSLDRLETP